MFQRNLVVAVAALCGAAASQSNTVNGLDGKLYDITSPTVWGRIGTFPNGQIGWSAANYMCNPGTQQIPWQQAMAENHPKFGFMVTRLNNDRLTQISNRSHIKHAFTSINGNMGPCAPCQNPLTGTVMGLGCYDVYGAGNNGDPFWLGPADELDPWLGTWNHTGSYFDRGDPDVGLPGNNDGNRSLTSAQISAFNVIKSRVQMNESDLQVPASTFYYQIHLVHQGENLSRRGDNLMSRQVSFSWNGTSWATANIGVATQGSILSRWPGATVSTAGNGGDDGRFSVAVKVTGPVGGLWHYEYAVHNVDNNRGAASFSVPVCPQSTVANIGFRDIDTNVLNQWTSSVGGGALTFSAPAGNPLNWNMLFNFWFDCDSAPMAGNATFLEARLGPGALSVAVPTTVPGNIPFYSLGDGCGTPAFTVGTNGVANSPNPAFALELRADPGNGCFLFGSFGTANLPLGVGCTQYISPIDLLTMGFYILDATGAASAPLAIPAGLPPVTLFVQGVSLAPGGPVVGALNASNGLAVRVAPSGCP